MNPAGVIVRYINWRKWKKWFFNIPLFLFQLVFMVVGTAIGKIKWSFRERLSIADFAIGGAISGPLILSYYMMLLWLLILAMILYVVIGAAIHHNIPWRCVWKAAQASHVRLCLKKLSQVPEDLSTYQYINFGYPKAEIENYWRLDQCKGRFEYREPTFEPTPLFIERMVKYAYDQVEKPVAREYDWLQLTLGYTVNFTIWLFRPSLWGKEVKPWFNLPGGREVCSSGVTACLWFGEATERTPEIAILQDEDTTFFKGYDIAMVMPCMFAISEKWRVK